MKTSGPQQVVSALRSASLFGSLFWPPKNRSVGRVEQIDELRRIFLPAVHQLNQATETSQLHVLKKVQPEILGTT